MPRAFGLEWFQDPVGTLGVDLLHERSDRRVFGRRVGAVEIVGRDHAAYAPRPRLPGQFGKREWNKLRRLVHTRDALRLRSRAAFANLLIKTPRPKSQQAQKVRPSASKIAVFMGRNQGREPVRPTASTGFMERATGIEPVSEAWEASILPLNYARPN